MGELSKKLNSGVGSPGPAYLFEDNIKYDVVSIEKVLIEFVIASRMDYGYGSQKRGAETKV